MEFGTYDDDSVMSVEELNDNNGNDESTPTAAGPLSPPSGAESLFLAGLATERLSAASVSHQIKANHKRNSTGGNSLVYSLGGGGGGSISRRSRTASSDRSLLSYASARSLETNDDFASCIGSESEMFSASLNNGSYTGNTTGNSTTNTNNPNNPWRGTLNNMTIEIPFTRSSIASSTNTSQSSSFHSRSPSRSMIFKIAEDAQSDSPTMATTTYSNPKFTETKKGPPPSTKSSSSSSGPDLSHVDPAEIVYSKAKDVWTWGKTVPVVGFFVKTTETVTGKALGVVGTDLGELDTAVNNKLMVLDSGVLNPAIVAIAKIVVDVAGKSEDTLKPIIDILMSKLGLIKSEADESTPDAHKPPEVTPVKK